MSLKKQPISYLSMQHPVFNAGQRRAKMYKTCIRSTCQCNTPFLTQGSEEQKCTKRASVQPLVYLYFYVYRYVWQIYSCKEDRILYRLTFHFKNNQSVTCQCNTPFSTQGSEEQKCTKRASVQPLVYLYLYVYRYVSQIYSCKEDRILYSLTFHFKNNQSVTCQCNTPFLTQDSEEQKCTKRASVQPLVSLYLYVYRYVWQIYCCKEDRILYRLTFHFKDNQSVTCQCNTPFLTQDSEEQKCTKRASVQPLVSLYLYVYRYVSQIYCCKEDRILYRLTFHLKDNQSVTCQCNTPFLTQDSEEQKCTKRASVQPLVYLYWYVYRYVWQIYSCKEDRILYRLTCHLKTTNQLPVNATPLF